jgi:uncharacterized metal-binding protein YceD (DUF177 family)
MSKAELVVPVADLERGPKHVLFELSEDWLRRTLEETGATASAPGQLDVTLSKNGNEVLVRGSLKVDLTMPCVVTLDPVPVPVTTEIMLMLSPKGGGRAGQSGAEVERLGRQRRPRGRAPKAARGVDAGAREQPEPTGHWEETPVLTDEDAGQDTYEGHEIVLDGFAREFLLLELPMFPRRSDLPTDTLAANPPLPAGSQPGGQVPLDPRLSPLAELKSRLEKIKKE